MAKKLTALHTVDKKGKGSQWFGSVVIATSLLPVKQGDLTVDLLKSLLLRRFGMFCA